MKSWGRSQKSPTFPQDIQPTGGGSKTSVITDKPAAESVCHNPDPLVRLIGCLNEATIIVEGVEMTALVDTRAQVYNKVRDLH